MYDEERKKRLNNLYKEQEETFGTNLELTEYNEEEYLDNYELDYSKIIIPRFKELKTIEDMDESVFAEWKVIDFPVMVVAGGLGTLSSVMLRKFFAGLHDDNYGKKPAIKKGHSGENIDWVPGWKQPGQFGHRWKFGHDILNPFEIDWKQYIEIAAKSGGFLPNWLKAPLFWIRHLLQDTFSKEGLPFPGNSLLRFLDSTDQKTREVLQILTTIKMRDIAGAGITNIVMGAYIWGTEKDLKRVIIKPNYRGFSLMLGANLITLLSGLLIPPPKTSFNWSTIPVISYYSIRLINLEKKIRKQLSNRESILGKNNNTLLNNRKLIYDTVLMNDEYYEEFGKYEKDIEDFYKKTINKHENLSKNIL